MPIIAKAGLLGKQAQNIFKDVDDDYLKVVEHGAILYMVENTMKSKSTMNKVLSFLVLSAGWEYISDQLVSAQRTGGDA